MPLTADAVLQENSGATSGANAGSVALTLPTGTTAGSTLIAVIAFGAQSILYSGPTGWVKDYDNSQTYSVSVWRKPPDQVAAGETSWTFTESGGTGRWAWYVAEVAGLDPLDPFEASAGAFVSPATGSSAVTRSTGSTAANPGTDTIIFGAFYSLGTTTTQPGTWSGYTNSLLTEVADVQGGAGGATASVGLAVARGLSGGALTGPFSSSATYTPNTAGDVASAAIAVYRSADSPITNALEWLYGFEQGTAAGLGNGGIGATGGAITTNWLVQASSARGSSYGCRMIASGTALYYLTGVTSTAKAHVMGFDMRMVSGSGTVVAAEILTTGTAFQLVYDFTNTRYGTRWGTGGTVAWQSGTTALNTWVWVDLRAQSGTATWHGDWRLETAASTYTAQTSPADLTGQTAGFAPQTRIGTNAAQTFTCDVDNLVTSAYGVTYPLGPHTVQIVKVDPAGTPTVNGTVGNFALVANNATGAALTSGTLTAARDALDELPVTVSASSDGIVQTTTAASDYIQFPMDTFTVGSASVIAGVQLLAPQISTTGAGGGLFAVHGWDGTTDAALYAPTGTFTPGSPTAGTLTAPTWATGRWSRVNGWTQAALDGATLRFGYSSDATPDMGVTALYLEVATRRALTARQITMEDDTFTCDVNLSPYSSASVSYIVTSNHATRGVTLDYSIGAVPQTGVYVAASSSSTVTVAVEVFGDVDSLTLTPDRAS